MNFSKTNWLYIIILQMPIFLVAQTRDSITMPFKTELAFGAFYTIPDDYSSRALPELQNPLLVKGYQLQYFLRLYGNRKQNFMIRLNPEIRYQKPSFDLASNEIKVNTPFYITSGAGIEVRHQKRFSNKSFIAFSYSCQQPFVLYRGQEVVDTYSLDDAGTNRLLFKYIPDKLKYLKSKKTGNVGIRLSYIGVLNDHWAASVSIYTVLGGSIYSFDRIETYNSNGEMHSSAYNIEHHGFGLQMSFIPIIRHRNNQPMAML
jgi:hypothetical protein